MKAICKSSRVTSGFTLPEIMVTLAIVATVSVLGYAGANRMLQTARTVQSIANLKSLAAANQGYVADFGVYCPANHRSNNLRWHGKRISSSHQFDPTEGLLAPYLGRTRSVGMCPLFKNMVDDASSYESGTGGYGYNSSYIGGIPGAELDPVSKLTISERPANVPDPARTVMFTTTAYARENGLQASAFCEPPFWDFGSGPTDMRPNPTVHFRANGKALVAWCDGHVTGETNNKNPDHGDNPHGGDSHEFDLGWFGTEQNNGAWNPRHPD